MAGIGDTSKHVVSAGQEHAGVLAAASKWRARVTPPPKAPAESDDSNDVCSSCTAKRKPATHRSGYRPWRELLMRSCQIDIEHCASCGGRMKLRALVMTTASIERYLRWLGEPLGPPTLAPARDPPYFKSQVIRRAAIPPLLLLRAFQALSLGRSAIHARAFVGTTRATLTGTGIVGF